MSKFTLLLIFVVFSYICGSTKATTNKDDEFLQAINLANSPNVITKPYTPIQEQQKQQQQQQQHGNQQQHQQREHDEQKLLQSQQPKKRSTTMTLRVRQKRSEHDMGTMGVYFRKIPTHAAAYNLALLNVMHTLRKQLSGMELARLRSHLSRSTAVDLELLNEIYNNNIAALYNDESRTLNDDEVDIGNGVDMGNNGASFIGTSADTDTGNAGGFGRFNDMGSVGGVGNVGQAVVTTSNGINDMLANDIDNLSEPWQFISRVSKKSSALYKPRLGKRTQEQQQQQQQQQQKQQ